MMTMGNQAALLEQARWWAERAEHSYARVGLSKDARCRLTALTLARTAERYANRAASLAVLAVPSSKDDDIGMQSKGGLHPYRAALFFILREARNTSRTSRQRTAALVAGDVVSISRWPMVRCIAHAFGKGACEVARDLIDTYLALEDGLAAP